MSTDVLSIYDIICQQLTPEGLLPEDFALPRHTPPGSLAFADGAMDGIIAYHMSPSEQDAQPLYHIVELIADDQPEQALVGLSEFFPLGEFKTMLSYIDPLQNWIYDHRDSLPANKLYQFARWQLTHSAHPETIKFALALLEMLNTQEEKALQKIIMTLALSDELTLFALFVIITWPDANDRLFELAQHVHGWGRIHTVDRLQPETASIQQWLLTEGWRNTVMPAYSAITCLQKGDLLTRLQQNMPCPGVDELLRIALEGGPVASLLNVDEGEALSACYLMLKTPLTLARLETLSVLEEGLTDTDWPTRESLAQQAQALLVSPEAITLLTQAIAQGEGYALALKLGLDCSQDIFERIQAHFEDSYPLAALLFDVDRYGEELITLFTKQLPLDTLATGPALELGTGPEFASYQKLVFIVQYLHAYPHKGQELLLCALQAPVVNCRNMALNVLEEWLDAGHTLSLALQIALRKLMAAEVDDDIRKRLQAIQHRQPTPF